MSLKNLPKSDDEYWDGAEKVPYRPSRIEICGTHTKENWTDHVGYKDNHDGTASCLFCGWGFMIPGYMRIHKGKVYDLRTV